MNQSLQRFFSLAITASFVLSPLSPALAQETTSMTDALKGIQSGIGMVGNVTGAIGASQQQMQAMVNQMAGLQAQQNLLNQNMGELDKVKARLALALAEAQSCMVGTAKDTSKFKKNNISPAAVTTTEATCRNYGNIIDSAKANILKMNEANAKIACMKSFQDKVNAAAESAKGPFNALTKAAQETWNIRDQIITLHKGIAEKLTNDLEGRDGYKAKLDSLKKLSIELNNVINGKAGGQSDNGLPTGLARKAENLKRLRTIGAKQWHANIMQDTQQCFYSDRSKGCDSSGTPASPYECIQRQLNPSARNNPGLAARNKYNQGELGEVFSLNFGKVQDIELDANIDVKDLNGFMRFSQQRFEKIATESANTLAQRKFAGNVNANQLAQFMRSKLNDCYSSAISKFKAGMESEGNQYKNVLNQIEDQEKDLANDTKVWIETVTKQMNEFRTSFQKVYNNELPQFTANCTVNEDPYTSVDCMRVLSVALKSGIEGTSQSIKLGNGTYYTSNEGATVLNVQGLAMDQSGKPTLNTSQVQCRGFNECLTFLEQSRTHNEQQVQTQTQEREKFVQDHNKNVDTALQSMAPQFTAISELIGRAVGEVNQDLAKSGVNSAVKTKQVDGETLSQNDKTRLYDMPKNMKSALAANGSYTEIEDTSEITTSLNSRLQELNKKVADAYRKKAQCAIKKEDYASIANKLPTSCRGEEVCRRDRTASLMTALEGLFNRTQSNPDRENNNSGKVAREYNSCVRSAKAGDKNASRISILENRLSSLQAASGDKSKEIAAAQGELDRLREEASKDSGDEAKFCSEQAANDLGTIAGSSRDPYKKNNQDLLAELGKMSEACGNSPADVDAAEQACKDFKEKANGATIASDEGETPDGASGTAPSTSNPLRTSTGAQ